MLREVPSFPQDFEHDITFLNTTALTRETEDNQNPPTGTDILDDVFGSAPASPIMSTADNPLGRSSNGSTRHTAGADEISDVHRLRSTHVTNGYREGVAVSKEKCMQEGFDEGYHLGAELGLRVGWCLGALEGIWHALKPSKSAVETPPSVREEETSTVHAEVAEMYLEAEQQLAMPRLYALEYFDADGIWLYDVQSQGPAGHEVTFEEIAAAHPLVKEWAEKVTGLAVKVGLHLE